VLDWIASVTGAHSARRGERIQSLWGGYGELFRVHVDARTAVVKHVRPPASAASISDARKRRSYEVEEVFYRDYAPRCDDTCRVARLYGSRRDDDGWLFVLEDLDAAGFPARRDDDCADVGACLAWLASFHARFLHDAGTGLWPEGTYWHLATRMDELANIRDASLRARAPELDAQLRGARFQTILHGDPKEANFCFSRDTPTRVAAVDFQYAGRGCGMKDVAYLLHGRRDRGGAHLDAYFRELRSHVPAETLGALEAEWRALYPVAQADFERFLAGWRP
jgi:hypothetical protein